MTEQLIRLAHLAGYIDGEGYLGLTSNDTARVEICNTCPATLLLAKRLFGGSVIGSKRSKKSVKDRYVWKYSISNKVGVRFLLQTIEPFLVEKRPQALLLLEYLDIDASNKTKREEIKQLLKRLKRIDYTPPYYEQ